MKSFKEHLNEQLLTELGDTTAGRQALARYFGRAERYKNDAARRAFIFFDQSKKIRESNPEDPEDPATLEKAERIANIGSGILRTKRYRNRVTGAYRAKSILKSAPPEEVEMLNKIYRANEHGSNRR